MRHTRVLSMGSLHVSAFHLLLLLLPFLFLFSLLSFLSCFRFHAILRLILKIFLGSFSCTVDHVPDWQPRSIILGLVGARSASSVKNIQTHTYAHTYSINTHTNTHTHTGTGTRAEARTVAEMGTGTRITGTGTRIGSGRVEDRRRSARSRKIVLDAMWETGETWPERGKMWKRKGWSSSCQPR